MAPRSLAGSVVAVVGASGGLGSAIARDLAARGAHLVLAGPHTDKLAALGIDGATTVHLDVRDALAGDALVAAVTERHGHLDGLVNAAGVVAFGSLVDTDDAAVEELFLINVIGPLLLTKRVVPMLSESKGFLVNLSAVVAEQPMANMAVYSATKAALTAADAALFRELRRLGIQVCDARPPHTETGLATRPLSGTAPTLPTGLSPQHVAACIVDAIESRAAEIPASQFTPAEPLLVQPAPASAAAAPAEDSSGRAPRSEHDDHTVRPEPS